MRAGLIAALSAGAFPAGSYAASGLIGGNFWGNKDWIKDYAFCDLVQTSRGFKPVADPYGSTDVTLSAQGWPTQDFVCVLLSEGIASDAGVYQCSFTGTATVAIQAGNPTLSSVAYDAGTNTSTFTVTASASIDTIQLRFTSLSGDFADLKVMRPGYSPSTTQVFRSEFLEHIRTTKVLRFMDWMITNNSTDATWAGSRAANSTSRYKYRNSLAAAAALCNTASKDCWVNVPHLFDDASISSFVSDLASRLNPTLNAYIEFSNETWNSVFTQFTDMIAAVKSAAGIRSRADLTSCSKTGGTATLVFAAAHGKTTGQQIFVGGITSITGGLVTITVVDATTVTWSEAGTATGTISTGNDNSYVLLNPTNQWSKPLTTYGNPAAYPNVYTAVVRYCVDRCRVIYDAVVAAGISARAKVVFGLQLGQPTAFIALAYAQMVYGDASWLTVSPAYYATPASPSAMTTEAAVFSQLETSRTAIFANAYKSANSLLSWNRQMISYEGGPHTDSKPNSTVATAVRSAHLSDTMRVFLRNLVTDWRNAGGDLYMHYTFGATKTFDTTANNTWPMIEGAVTDTSQAKYKAITEQWLASAAPAQVDTVNWGTIPLTSAWLFSFDNSDANGNKILSTTFVCPDLCINVVAATAGTYTLTLNACSASGASDWITILVNGAVVANQVACPTQSPFAGAAPQMWTGAVTLAAGRNVVSLRPRPNTRSGQIGLRTLVIS